MSPMGASLQPSVAKLGQHELARLRSPTNSKLADGDDDGEEEVIFMQDHRKLLYPM